MTESHNQQILAFAKDKIVRIHPERPDPPKRDPTVFVRVDPTELELPPEQAAHYERFTGRPYDAEEKAKWENWRRWKSSNWHAMAARDQAQREDRLRKQRERNEASLAVPPPSCGKPQLRVVAAKSAKEPGFSKLKHSTPTEV